MKIIDLLDKIANGEEVPKKIRIDHWCYKFEWVEHESNYYDKHEDIDLMSCLSCDKEELNYEVHELKEEKKIPEKIPYPHIEIESSAEDEIRDYLYKVKDKFDELIDYLQSKGDK